jgi:hypothetical protein
VSFCFCICTPFPRSAVIPKVEKSSCHDWRVSLYCAPPVKIWFPSGTGCEPDPFPLRRTPSRQPAASMMKSRLLFALVAFIAATTSAAKAQSPVPSVVVPLPGTALPVLPAPRLLPTITPRRDPALIQRLTPRVEVWRSNGDRPQIPVRRNERGNIDPALVTGTEPVTIRLRFDPRSAGEQVTVIAARGVLLDSPQTVLTISPRGDCTFAAQLSAGAPRGQLITYCKNVRTMVPLQRAPLSAVQAWETQSGGRP